MLYSDFLVLKFFRDIEVYEKITVIKNFFPHLTRFRISMSPHTHAFYITHYITLEALSVSKHLVLYQIVHFKRYNVL